MIDETTQHRRVTERTSGIQRSPSAYRGFGTTLLDRDGDFIRRLLITIATFGLAYFLWKVSHVLLLVFAAALLAILLSSFARLLCERAHVPEKWSLTVATLISAAVLIGIGALLGAQATAQFNEIAKAIPGALDAAGQRVGIPNASEEVQRTLMGEGGQTSTLSRAAGWGYTALGALGDLILVVIAAIYLAADPRLYRRGLAKMLPPSQHDRVFDAMDTTGNALRLWFWGQAATMLVVGVASLLAYWWIGLPSPLALALIAALTNFVPYIGPIVGAIPALIFALAKDQQTLIWTLAAVVIIQQIEGNFLTPFIQSRTVMMPPVLALFSIVVFGYVFGVLGAIVAAPLTVTLMVLIKKLWIRETLGEDTEIPGEDNGDGAAVGQGAGIAKG